MEFVSQEMRPRFWAQWQGGDLSTWTVDLALSAGTARGTGQVFLGTESAGTARGTGQVFLRTESAGTARGTGQVFLGTER